MKKRIPYREWREGLFEKVPMKNRVGTEFLFIESAEGLRPANDGPLIFDVTSAIFVTEGSTDISINMKMYHVQAPAIIVLLPDAVIQYGASCSDNKSFCLIMSPQFFVNMFNDSMLQTSLYTKIHNDPIISLPQSNAGILHMFKDLLTGLMGSPICEHKLETARHLTLALFYGYIISQQISDAPKAKSRADEIFKNFISLLREDYNSHREVAYYADRLCVTPKYLSSVVKEVSGKSPMDWIDEYVVTAAKAMLSSSNQSIDEISLRLNFASLSLFGKFFKRVTGLSPRAYRNTL